MIAASLKSSWPARIEKGLYLWLLKFQRRPRPQPTLGQSLMALHRREMRKQRAVNLCLLILRPSLPRLLAVIGAERKPFLVSLLTRLNTPSGCEIVKPSVPAAVVRKPPSWLRRHCPPVLSVMAQKFRYSFRWLMVQLLRRLMLAALCLLLRSVLLALWLASSRGQRPCSKSPPRSPSAS